MSLVIIAQLAFASRVEGQVTVGPNIQVSIVHPDRFHDEVILASDPQDARHLLACSMVFSPTVGEWSVIIYTSGDGGLSWRPTFESRGQRYRERNGDPACTFGVDGTAVFTFLSDQEGDTALERLASHLHAYWSPDGGTTWTPSPVPADLGSLFDREYVAVDHTHGPYRGRIYLHGQRPIGTVDASPRLWPFGVALLRSLDGGKSFERPVLRFAETSGRQVFELGNGVLMSNGTFVCLVEQLDLDKLDKYGGDSVKPSGPQGSVKVLLASPGGDSLSPAVLVSELYKAWGADVVMPSLAVDPGSRAFRDRLYAAWDDWRVEPREVLLAYSADSGRTWSKPVVVNEPRRRSDPGASSNDFGPLVAVNAAGVVGVAWRDRRESVDGLGWQLRFAASFDGGETFTPSLPVSTGRMKAGQDEEWLVTALGSRSSGTAVDPMFVRLLRQEWSSGGHTSGITADANGTFHLLWADNHTGVHQLWTSAIRVAGEGVRQGDTTLAELEDISRDVEAEVTNVAYERKTQTLTAELRLRNISDSVISGPIRVRAVAVRSDVGIPAVVNAENGSHGAGAIWTIHGGGHDDRLAPSELSAPTAIRVHLADPLVVELVRPGKAKFNHEVLDLGLRAFSKPLGRRPAGAASPQP